MPFRIVARAMLVLVLALIGGAHAACADAPPPQQPLVLLPFEEPGGTDPHAAQISAFLEAQLHAAGIAVTAVAATDHLGAVADAATICARNGAAGILIPEGRYEQTLKSVFLLYTTFDTYPTHVEFRLDDVGCDGHVRRTIRTVGDTTRQGAVSVGNIASAIDSAFRDAVRRAVAERADAHPQAARIGAAERRAEPQPSTAAPTPLTGAQTPAPMRVVLVPIEDPGLADPRAPEMTKSLLARLQKRGFAVASAAPIDHLTTPSAAPQLCAANTADAIVVPTIRVEQTPRNLRSHASARIDLLDCRGAVMRTATAEAESSPHDPFREAFVRVADRAMVQVLDRVFPPQS